MPLSVVERPDGATEIHLFGDMTIYLNAGESYTLVGYGNYAAGDVRWRVYNLDGSYNGNLSSTNTYTATQDCYVRIMLYNNPTEEQRS